MRLLRLIFRIILVVSEEIIVAIDEPSQPAQFDGYRFGSEHEELSREHEEVTYGV